MAQLTKAERAAIAEGLARIPPEARRVPTGASGYAVDYRWDGKKLVDVTPIEGRAVDRSTYRGSAIARASALRRIEISEDIKAGMTLRQIRRKRGITAELVKSVANIVGLKITPEDAPVSGADQVTARIVVAANGRRDVPEIAKIAGCSMREVRLARDRLGLNIPARAGKGVAA